MNNLPKFISIKSYNGKVHFINVSHIERVVRCEEDKTVEFWLSNGYICFEEPDYPTAKAAWVEVWKVTP